MSRQATSNEQNTKQTSVNITLNDRNMSMLGGAMLLFAGMFRRGLIGKGMSALGASMVFQSGTGKTPVEMLKGNQQVSDSSAQDDDSTKAEDSTQVRVSHKQVTK